MTSRPPTLVLVFAVPVIALVAVVGTRAAEGPSTPTAARAGANTVVIKDFAFNPPKLSVARGTILKVSNADGTTHTLSARDGSFNTGDLSGGKKATIALEQSGRFSYYCKIHDSMTGSLVVK
jgi:plastocyanin